MTHKKNQNALSQQKLSSYIICLFFIFCFIIIFLFLFFLLFQDKLFLNVDEGEKDGPAPGLIPSFVPGLTPEAEIFNGRMAMMGLVVTATVALSTGQTFLEVVNAGLGGLLM